MKGSMLFAVAGLAVASTALAGPKTPVVAPGEPTAVYPQTIAPIYMVDGQVVVGQEMPYSPFQSRLTGYALAWDGYQGDQTNPTAFPPIGGDVAPCALAATSRYYFGTGALNAHFVNDFNNAAAGSVGRGVKQFAFGWWHNPTTSPELFRVRVFWWNDFNGDCLDAAAFGGGTNSIIAAKNFITGVQFSYGTLAAGTGYYTSLVNLSTLNLAAMPDADGAYQMQFLRTNTTAAPVNADFSTRSQPMLWAAAGDANTAGGFPPYAGQPRPGGPSNPTHWDDDGGQTATTVAPDGVFADSTGANGNECYSYAFTGLCYRPLGAMAAWFYQDCVANPAFNQLSPANGASGLNNAASINLSWEVNGSPTGYNVDVKNASNVTVFTANNLLVDNVDIPANTLGAGQTYTWTVAALAGTGCPSTTAGPRSFSTAGGACTADYNGDTVVDFFDYLDFVADFSSNAPRADFNADTVIDFFDYLDFVAAFSTGC